MIIPGANILNMALGVIGRQEFCYKKFLSRAQNSIGLDVATYAPDRCLSGSVQPVARNLYQNMGLDFQRNYINVYVSREMLDIERDVSGDQIVFKGDTYNCISRTPWHAIDGWDQVLAVMI